MNYSLNNCIKYGLKLRLNDIIIDKNRLFLNLLNNNCLRTSLRVLHSKPKTINDKKSSGFRWTEEESDLRQEFNSSERRIAKTFREHRLQQRLEVDQPLVPRLAKIALIGSPNAGKSTLTNQLVGRKISSVSSKVHTTRHKVIGIIVSDDTQIQLLDTPGVVSANHCAKHELEATFMSDPLGGAEGADIIAVICDASNPRERERLNAGVLRLLERNRNKESVLIINKIDKINEKRKLLDITTRLTEGVVGGVSSIKPKKPIVPNNTRGLETLFTKTEDNLKPKFNLKTEGIDENAEEVEEKVGWNRFSHVFMTSALDGDGVDDIVEYFMSRAKFHPWIYHRSQVTDQSPQELVKTTLKETFLDTFREEIPYKISFVVTMWHLDETGNIFVSVDVLCPQRFLSLVIGPKGQTIASIVRIVRESLTNTFHCEVSLKLIVKGIQNK